MHLRKRFIMIKNIYEKIIIHEKLYIVTLMHSIFRTYV